MYKALYLSPMIQSSDVIESAAFFQQVLGFTLVRKDNSYIILSKENCTLHIKQVINHRPESAELYLEVDQIDIVWDSIKGKLKGIKVKEPFTQPYGMKEFHLLLPNTNTVLFVGQWIREE